MNTQEIMDFTDYAQPIDFKFQDNIFRIPAFGKSKLEKLMMLNRKFTELQEQEDAVDKESDGDEVTEVTEEAIKRNTDFLTTQDEFIAAAIMIKDGDDYKDVSMDQMNTWDWPVKVKAKVMEAITKQMSSVVEEDEIEKKS